jgi:peptidoglycan/xylan/chitin deacetylase (PgdA/CDA1 family)
MMSRLKHSLCESAYRSGLLGLAAAAVEPRANRPGDRPFQVLIYHRVGDDGDAFVPAMSVAGFARHMRCLREHFHPMSLSAVLAAAARREVPPRAVAVTFDDGYLDVHTHALPILRRYAIPATVYVATAFMEDGRPMWNDRIGAAFRSPQRAVFEGVDGLPRFSLDTPADRERAARRVISALKRRAPLERDRLTAAVLHALAVPATTGPQMLRWEQVRALHAAGIDIGAHTVHHPILTTLSPDEAAAEILGSKRTIEDQLQTKAEHFAYPNGTPEDFDATTQAHVEQAGFTSAASTVFGLNTAATDRFALRRGGPWEEEAAVFTAKLWWYRWRDRDAAGPRDGRPRWMDGTRE